MLMYGTIMQQNIYSNYIIFANLCLNNSTQFDCITSSSNLFHYGTVLGKNEYLYRSMFGW